jgi:hypothetical protein
MGGNVRVSVEPWVVVVVAIGLIGPGCSDITAPADAVGPAPPPNVRAYVAGAALNNLNEDGHFRLSAPVIPGPYAAITAAEAEAIANAVIRTWYANPGVVTIPGGSSLAESAEKQHGGRIDWSAVKPTPRDPYFAESHLDPVPHDLGNPTVRWFGPWYLVPMYEGSTPVATVTVAAYATNLEIDSRGFVHRAAPDGGSEFRVLGIPLAGGGLSMPFTPEAAVEFAFNVTGIKTIEVPVLGVLGNRIASAYARWQIVLERPVTLERLLDHERVVTDTVYVGMFPSSLDGRRGLATDWDPPRARLFVAAESQPATEDILGTQVQLRPGYVVDLHEVRASSGN